MSEHQVVVDFSSSWCCQCWSYRRCMHSAVERGGVRPYVCLSHRSTAAAASRRYRSIAGAGAQQQTRAMPRDEAEHRLVNYAPPTKRGSINNGAICPSVCLLRFHSSARCVLQGRLLQSTNKKPMFCQFGLKMPIYVPFWRVLTLLLPRREQYHGLRGSASPVLTATGFANGRWQFSTPTESTPVDRSPKKWYR